jgi:DnaJ-class molecular chaperone
MKRINEYRKLFKVESDTDLKELKKTYRGLVKEWHPDKFQDDKEKEEAELKSQVIIDGYHFLVSIAPETKDAYLTDYIETTTKSGIADFNWKKRVLEMTFIDGSSYEYFGVPEKVFQKLVNTDKQMRFCKRGIFNSYLYRKSKRGAGTKEAK